MCKTYEDMIDQRLNSWRNKKNKLEKILLIIPMGKKIFMKVKYRTEVDEQAEYNGKLIPLYVEITPRHAEQYVPFVQSKVLL